MCFFRKRKISTSNTIEILPNISTPNIRMIDPIKKIQELENVLNEIITQLNNHFEFNIKSKDECIENIYSLCLFTCKKYNINK